MFHPSTNDQGSSSAGNTLDASLVITTVTTSSSPASSGKSVSHWRRLSIAFIVSISLKKTNVLRSPTSSSAHDDSVFLLQQSLEDSNIENPVHENGFLGFVSEGYGSFSRKSFKSIQGDSISSYVPAPSPPADQGQGLAGNLSTQYEHVVEIPSHNEGEDDTEQQAPPTLRECLVRIVKERDLNSLKEFGGVEKAASAFDSHLENGRQHGVQDPEQVLDTSNPIQTKEFFRFLWKTANRYTILLLLISAGLSFPTEILEQGPTYGWHDGVAILAAVFTLLTFQSVSNFHRARKLEKLWKEKNKLRVEVVRGGQKQPIIISDIVAGDIVCLKEGVQVPADGLVVSSNGLESDDVLNPKIDGEWNPFLLYGSKIMKGHGRMLVTSVRDNRKLSKMLSLVIKDFEKKTLLEAQTEKTNADMEKFSLCFSIFIAVVALIRFLCRKNHGDDDVVIPELKGNVSVGMLMKIFERILLKPNGKISILVSALTVAVIAIQHGMPIMITISLSFWNEKVENSKAKPQNLSASATMGIVTRFFIDTTGWPACEDTKVDKFRIGEQDVNSDEDSEIDQTISEALQRGIYTLVRLPQIGRSDVDSKIHQTVVEASDQGIGTSVFVPDIFDTPTKESLVSWAETKWRLKMENLDQNLSIHSPRKLSSDKKGYGILMKINGDEEEILHMHWSGAASTILDMCSRYYDIEGSSHAIFNDKRIKFQKVIDDMEDSGLRSIAFACGKTKVPEIKEDGLHLLALAGLKNPYQEIKLAIGALRNAGIRIILISEDELSAVKAIGCELGVFRPDADDVALESEQIRNLTDSEMLDKIDRMTVMGRCLSQDKITVVQFVKEKVDHVVAFLGGYSASDIPVLKEADVGISQDTKCTEMARESSDIVISARGSLPLIVKFGRWNYDNIQKFSQLQMTVGISGSLITLIMTMCLEESPLTTIQLYWVNGIVCLLGGLMMTMELQCHELFTKPPGKRTHSLVTKILWRNIVIQVLCQAVVLLIFLFKGLFIPTLNKDDRKAMIFTGFTLCQIFNLLNAMGVIKKKVLVVVLRNCKFLVALGIALAAQVLVVEFVQKLTGGERLNGVQWVVCFLLAALLWGLDFAVKVISDSLLNWYSRSRFPRREQWPNFPFLIIPFPMFLIFSLTYYYDPDVAGLFARYD